MAHKSFEKPDIARLLYERFIIFKVDRQDISDLAIQSQGASCCRTQRSALPFGRHRAAPAKVNKEA
jgi:uncharacterized protein YyaL (SSP411 family)